MGDFGRCVWIGFGLGIAMAILTSLLSLTGPESAEEFAMLTGALAFPASWLAEAFFGLARFGTWARFPWASWPLEGLFVGFCVGAIRLALRCTESDAAGGGKPGPGL